MLDQSRIMRLAGSNLLRHLLAVGLSLGFVRGALAQTTSSELPSYKRGGFTSMVLMGKELFKALSPKAKSELHFQPVNLDSDAMPFVRTEELQLPDMARPMRMVFISVGFVELVNYVAHAKAIDKIEKGFFLRYVLSLAAEAGDRDLKELPKITNPAYWTEGMMNEQESNFNQMVGILLAIELSHHYLGHFQKYAAQLKGPDDTFVPINGLLTPAEWENSVKAGARNALQCGYGVDGVIALYEAIEKMPQRPPWTTYFLPPGVKVARLKRDLKRIEDNFFAGGE
jgi:hypothetical protein